MKYTLFQIAVLIAVVALIVAAGRGPAIRTWGPAGLASLHAAAVICLAGALLAAIPLGLAATYWPTYAPHVAFAGTAVRLLSSAALALAYQTYAQPALSSFLACLVAVYLLLLVVETGLIVYIVRRVSIKKAPDTR
jgi:hypothetical protein